MRKNMIVTIMFVMLITALCFTVVSADNYYISNSGNDSNSGTSESEPWATLEKVNGFDFAPGDVIHFKSGDVWRGTLYVNGGEDGQYVTYTSYGTGDKPLLLGSTDKSSSSDWINNGGNIWVTTMNIKSRGILDVGNIIFDNGKAVGVKVFKNSDLKKQNDFWYDRKSDTLAVYSSGNPADRFDSIECALMRDIIYLDQKSYVIVAGLALKYGGGCGIYGEDAQYMRIINNDISYIGGSLLYWEGDTPVRYGNGINFWNNVHDILVEGNNIWEIYDTAVSNQGDGEGNRIYNITYKNNKISNAQWSFEMWHRDSNTTVSNVVFENNICKDAGYTWGSEQRPNGGGGFHLSLFESAAKMSNISIRNNVFENAETMTIFMSSNWNNRENLAMDNNTYIQQKNKGFAYYMDNRFYSNQFENYISFSGKDTNSNIYYNNSNNVALAGNN